MKNIFVTKVVALLLGATSFVECKDKSAFVKSLNQLPGWPDSTDFDMYSGHVKINGTKSIHYVLTESQSDPAADPLILWYNGGPGCSSMMGMLSEHGPYVIGNGESVFKKNNYAWNREASVLYVEQPAGVGFSICENEDDCSHTDLSSAVDNLDFLTGWYDKFPEFKPNKLFVSGESYAGIYVPHLALQIHNHNKKSDSAEKINLAGLMVGNGVTNWHYDTIPTMISQAYYRNILNVEAWDELQEDKCVGLGYFDGWTQQCLGLFRDFRKVVNDVNVYNIYGHCYHADEQGDFNATSSDVSLFLSDKGPVSRPTHLTFADYTPWMKWMPNQKFEDIVSMARSPSAKQDPLGTPACVFGGPFIKYMNDKKVQEQLNIPSDFKEFWDLCERGEGFQYEMNKTASQWIYEELKGSGIQVLKYSGDDDLVVSTMGTEKWLNRMNWNVSREWEEYHLGDMQTAGYLQQYNDGEFTFLTVHDAGHMVPLDQREKSYYIIFNWLFGRGEFAAKTEIAEEL